MDELYATYGSYREKVVSFVFEGLDGQDQMKGIMKKLREEPPAELGGRICRVRDYQSGLITDLATGKTEPTGLPQSNILFYELEGGGTAIIRPSGTEPKIKFYIMAAADSGQAAEEALARIEAAGAALLG